MKTIRKVSILLMLLFSSILVYGQCESYLEKGDVLFSQKKYDEAKKQYQAYLVCNPNTPKKEEINKKIAKCAPLPTLPVSAKEWYNEGEKHSNSGNYQKAIDCYRKALDKDASISSAWNGLANAYVQQQMYTEAINWYKKMEENNPSSTMWRNIALCYQNMQEYYNAIEYYKKAENTAPSGNLWNEMGFCYRELNDYDKAIECFQKSGNINEILNLADTFRRNGKYEKAVEYYEKVTTSRPSASVWYEMGICYRELKEYDKAIECCQKSNNIDNSCGRALYVIGLSYAGKKNLSKSKDFLKKAAQLGNSEAQKLLDSMKVKWRPQIQSCM